MVPMTRVREREACAAVRAAAAGSSGSPGRVVIATEPSGRSSAIERKPNATCARWSSPSTTASLAPPAPFMVSRAHTCSTGCPTT